MEFSKTNSYDALGRLLNSKYNTTSELTVSYTYVGDSEAGTTTTLVASVNIGGKVLSYTYDEDGNITEIKENNVLKESYSYDDLGQMTRENNLDNNQTILYTYDGSGNIGTKEIYPYTVGAVSGTPETITYSYDNENWGDLLTAYNGEAITYDKIGNPLKYRSGMQFQWEGGRKLTSFSTPNAAGNYVYNADGIRVYKEVNGNKTEYYLNGTEIETEITNFGGITRRVDYIYDENGSIYGFVVDNTAKYYYTKNLQGDVIGILDASGTQIVEYSYDAWGKATVSYPNTSGLTDAEKQARYLLGSNNPFRYRGYYFDNETGLYLTGTRYYDPEIGRFINADGQINDDILGTNLFAYCGNNPVTRADDTGRGWWVVAGALIGGIAGGVTKIVSNVTTGKKWNEGVIGATVGGAVYGGVLAATGNVWAAGFASAAAESLTNEVVSYIPKVSQANGQTVTKKVTTGNVIDSTKTVLNDTAVNGTISAVTGKIAGKIVPTNNGWFKPQKFVSSFAGKYAIKSELQTLTQSGLLFGVEGLKYSFNQRLKQGQQPIVTFFPDTEIRAAG